jgi:hypothetical protein
VEVDSADQNHPEMQPRISIIDSMLIGVGMAAVGLFVSGAMGWMSSEYRLPRWQEAFLLPVMASCYGIVPGLIIGLILNWSANQEYLRKVFGSLPPWAREIALWCEAVLVVIAILVLIALVGTLIAALT